MRAGLRLSLLLLLSGGIPPAVAESISLPDPLTLGAALSLAGPGHPTVAMARAELERSRADLLGAEAQNDPYLAFTGRLRVVEPPSRALDRERNDSSAQIRLRQRLYDFGYSEAREAAASAAVDGQTLRHLDAQQRQQLEVMRRFFDVLLADLSYAHDNEDMATAFVAVDKARDRSELGQVSDVELFRLESVYQESRSRRFASEARQRATRALLALSLNRPGDLPSRLIMPEMPQISRERPEYESLLAAVLAGNPRLLALRAELRSAQSRLAAAHQAEGPVLHAEAGAGKWNRETRSTFPAEAGLVLEVPIYAGRRTDAAVAEARAEALASQARLAEAEFQIREHVLGIWLDLETLAIEWEKVLAQGDYRDLYLDRSRALYELEVKADLGDAMVATSAVRLHRAEIMFRWLLAQARLHAFQGGMPAAVIDSGISNENEAMTR